MQLDDVISFSFIIQSINEKEIQEKNEKHNPFLIHKLVVAIHDDFVSDMKRKIEELSFSPLYLLFSLYKNQRLSLMQVGRKGIWF